MTISLQTIGIIVKDMQKTLAFYRVLDFRSDLDTLEKILQPNEAALIEVVLQRRVDKTVFTLTNDLTPGPIDSRPKKQLVD